MLITVLTQISYFFSMRFVIKYLYHKKTDAASINYIFSFPEQIDSTLKETLKDHMLRKYAGDEAFDEYSQAWNYAFIEVFNSFLLHKIVDIT